MAPDNRRDDPAEDAAVSVVDEPPGGHVDDDDDDVEADEPRARVLAADEPGAEAADDVDDDAEAPSKSKKRSHVRAAIEWVIVLGAAVAVALILRTFVLSAFYIPSGSMEPTLNVGDRVLVNKLSYKMHDVNRGDVVVFERPPGESDSSIKDLIKRVIALPGETVEGVEGTIYICEQRCAKPSEEGRPLTEPYVICPTTDRNSTFAPRDVGPEQVWVMGDNRCGSSDSRVFGPIETDTIVGRAFVIVYPIADMGWL